MPSRITRSKHLGEPVVPSPAHASRALGDAQQRVGRRVRQQHRLHRPPRVHTAHSISHQPLTPNLSLWQRGRCWAKKETQHTSRGNLRSAGLAAVALCAPALVRYVCSCAHAACAHRRFRASLGRRGAQSCVRTRTTLLISTPWHTCCSQSAETFCGCRQEHIDTRTQHKWCQTQGLSLIHI